MKIQQNNIHLKIKTFSQNQYYRRNVKILDATLDQIIDGTDTKSVDEDSMERMHRKYKSITIDNYSITPDNMGKSSSIRKQDSRNTHNDQFYNQRDSPKDLKEQVDGLI